MVTKVNSLVLGNAEVHDYHLNSDVFGSSAGKAVQGNTTISIATTGSLNGGGTITMGVGGTITINYNEPTNVSHFTNDANYTSVGDGISVFTNNVGYVTTGSNLSVFSNDVGYVVGGSNVSIFNNDANYTSVGDNVSLFINDAGYLTTETDPTVPSHVKAITALQISNWNAAYGWGDHSLAGYIVGSSTDDVPEGLTNLYHTRERVEDDVANILLAGNNITIVHDDVANTITISGAYPDLQFNDTDDLSEGVTNLYFTNERVDDRVASLLVAGSNISLIYDDIANTLTINSSGTDLSGSTTDQLSEGSTNLYFTTARARTSLSGGTGVIYNNTTGSISIGQDVSTTANVTFSVVDVDYIDFSTSATPTHLEGRVYYDNTEKALTVYNDEADIGLQIGQEEWIRVYNNSGVSIPNGSPVYISGANSGYPTVALCNATSVDTYEAIGLSTHTIASASFGYVTVRGIVRGIDTSGLIAGETVYVGTLDGSLTSTSPTYPYFPHKIGKCIVSDISSGLIHVSITSNTVDDFRVLNDAYIGGDLTVIGDMTVIGTQTLASVTNLQISENLLYLNAGDTIGTTNTNFTGTGLNDATLVGHYNGTTSQTFYVRIDATGTPDTFEWSLDNFVTTEATGVAITGLEQVLLNGIKIEFNSTIGHTVGDVWSGTASPVNIDTGFISNRNTGATGVGYTHIGMFFDITDSKWKIFNRYDPEPQSGPINTADASFTLSTLVVDTVEGNISWTNVTDKPDPVVGVTLTGDVTGSGSTTLTDLTNGNIAITTSIPGTTSLTLASLNVTDLVVTGNQTINNQTTLTSDDPLFILNATQVGEPDIGMIGAYNDGAAQYSGIFRDASDNKWKVFDGYTPTLTGNTSSINIADPSFSLTTLVADTFEGNLVGNVDWSGVTNKPDPIITVNLSGDVLGSGNTTLTDLANGTINVSANIADTSSISLANLDITGNLNVLGNTTTVNQTTLTVSDSKIFLADGNPSDAIDIGVIFEYNDGVINQSAGIFRDATDGKFKLMSTYTPVVGTTINTADSSYSLGTFVANSFEGSLDWSYVANKPDPQITVTLSGDVSGTGNTTLNNLGNGSISINAVVADDSHIHDGRYYTEAEADALFAPISHTHPYDNYGSWTLYTDGVSRGGITSGEGVNIVGGTNVVVGYEPTNNTVTITANDTNTTDWRVASGSGAEFFAVNATDHVRFIGGGATSVAFDANVKSITFTSTDTDTWRPIDNSPVSGNNDVSISSNWAYTHNVATSVHGATSLNTASRIVARDASGNFSAGIITASLDGTALESTKWSTARTITLSGDLAGNVSFDGSANATLNATIVADSVALGTDTTGNYVAAVGVSGNGLGITGLAGEGATFTVTSNATSANTGNTIVYRDANGNFSASIITATATQARYADLAEKYTTKIEHPVGTVMMVSFSEEYETEPCKTYGIPIGIVSEKPAILMNEAIDGQPLALKGRVPVRVVGPVKKGETVYVYDNGTASTIHNGKPIVGIALETNTNDKEKLVECVVMV